MLLYLARMPDFLTILAIIFAILLVIAISMASWKICYGPKHEQNLFDELNEDNRRYVP